MAYFHLIVEILRKSFGQVPSFYRLDFGQGEFLRLCVWVLLDKVGGGREQRRTVLRADATPFEASRKSSQELSCPGSHF